MNIPNLLWQIWVGPNPAPSKWMKTWPAKHPGWQYQVVDNNWLSSRVFHNQHLIDEYRDRGQFNGVSDLVRYELLYEHGGFMPEADSICNFNTNELWNEDKEICYTVYESETIRPGYVSPILACNPGNKFLKIIIDTLHQLAPADLQKQVWKSTGNAFLAAMIERHQPHIQIFPSHYFIPKHFKDKSNGYSGPDKIYAYQFWGSTRKTYDQGR